MFKRYRKLTKVELQQIQELNRMATMEQVKAAVFAENTALLNPNGKQLAEQQKQIATLIERVKNEHVNAKLAEIGYPKDGRVSLDLQTGKITTLE